MGCFKCGVEREILCNLVNRLYVLQIHFPNVLTFLKYIICVFSLLNNISNRDGMIHLPPNSILSRYLCADTICIAIFFKNLDSTSIAIRYCYVLRFLFLTLDHGKKLNDTLNIYTDCHNLKKNTHLSNYYCDSILQFIVIFVCLLMTRQWKIVDYTLKRASIWWVILSKTMHHIFLNFYFRSIHIHSVYLKYLEPWNFQVPKPWTCTWI